jgi:hypothetical protein
MMDTLGPESSPGKIYLGYATNVVLHLFIGRFRLSDDMINVNKAILGIVDNALSNADGSTPGKKSPLTLKLCFLNTNLSHLQIKAGDKRNFMDIINNITAAANAGLKYNVMWWFLN